MWVMISTHKTTSTPPLMPLSMLKSTRRMLTVQVLSTPTPTLAGTQSKSDRPTSQTHGESPPQRSNGLFTRFQIIPSEPTAPHHESNCDEFTEQSLHSCRIARATVPRRLQFYYNFVKIYVALSFLLSFTFLSISSLSHIYISRRTLLAKLKIFSLLKLIIYIAQASPLISLSQSP